MIVVGLPMRMGVGVGMRVRVGMIVAVVVARPMFVSVAMLMLVAVPMAVGMIVPVLMTVFVVMSAYADRRFSGQPASAIITHQSMSKEANSISRPARSSPLRL